MPLYEYECPEHGTFETIRTIPNRETSECPQCGLVCKQKISLSTFKMYNPFTKDGEGFKSECYGKEEFRHRVRNNMMREDKV